MAHGFRPSYRSLLVILQNMECYGVVEPLFLNCILPQGVLVPFVYDLGFIDLIRNFNSILMSSLGRARSYSSDDSLPLLKGVGDLP